MDKSLPNTTPLPPLLNKDKSKHNFLFPIILLSLLILSIINGGLYLLNERNTKEKRTIPSVQSTTPKPSVTHSVTSNQNSWKTYSNQKYSFEFKYPSNNQTKIDDKDMATYLRIQNYPNRGGNFGLGTDEYYLEMTISENQKDDNTNSCINAFSQYDKIKIGSDTGYLGEPSEKVEDGHSLNLCVETPTFKYQLGGRGGKDSSIIKSILSTFKLLDEITPTIILSPSPTLEPISNWKTFINGNYGYSLKYPNSWRELPSIAKSENGQDSPVGKIINLYSSAKTRNPPLLQIETFNNSSLKEYEHLKQSYCKNAKREIVIDEVKETMGENIDPPDATAPYYVGYHACLVVYKDNKVYNFIWFEGDKNNSGLFEKILSTFKFLSST